MLRRLRSRQNPERGATMIEFTLSILVIFFLVFWIWEMVMAIYTYAVLSDAAKEGVRYAIVYGKSRGTGACSGPGCTDSSAVNVINVVKDYATYSLRDISAITVTVAYPDGNCDPNSLVTVSVAYDYIPWLNLPWAAPRLRTGAQGRIVY